MKPNTIYREYSIWAEEGKDLATGLFQVYPNKRQRKSIELLQPAKIEFDQEILAPDSAEVTGVFYEVQRPLESFTGTHTIVFTDDNAAQYSDEFVFVPFRLVNDFGSEISRSQLVLELEGLEEGEPLRVVVTDTSFSGNGINEIDTVRGGRLDLTKRVNEEIVNGPVILQLFKEVEQPLNSKPAGGRISITYSIKREFELKD